MPHAGYGSVVVSVNEHVNTDWALNECSVAFCAQYFSCRRCRRPHTIVQRISSAFDDDGDDDHMHLFCLWQSANKETNADNGKWKTTWCHRTEHHERDKGTQSRNHNVCLHVPVKSVGHARTHTDFAGEQSENENTFNWNYRKAESVAAPIQDSSSMRTKDYFNFMRFSFESFLFLSTFDSLIAILPFIIVDFFRRIQFFLLCVEIFSARQTWHERIEKKIAIL